MSHTLINCTCKNQLCFSSLPLLWYYSILRGSIDPKNAKTKEIWRQTVKTTQLSLVPIGLDDFQIFQTMRHMHEAWKQETYVQSQSFPSELAVISPRQVKKDSNIPCPGRTRSVKCPIPQGQQRQSNPHPMPCLPPCRHDIVRCISLRAGSPAWIWGEPAHKLLIF